MNAEQLAKRLMETPSAEVLVLVPMAGEAQRWVRVTGVKHTGSHRNAVTFEVEYNIFEDEE